MDYSLTVTRKIGRYTQKAVVTVSNASTVTGDTDYPNWYGKMQTWLIELGTLDPTDQTLTETVMNSMTQNVSEDLGNHGSKADVLITIANTRSPFPKTITIALDDIAKGTLAGNVMSKLIGMLNMDIYTSATGYCITSCILNLHD